MKSFKSYICKCYNIDRKLNYFFYSLWNRLKFYLNGVRYGSNFKVFSRMYLGVGYDAKITIGNNFKFTSGDCINPLCRNIRGSIVANPKAYISIGDNVGMSSPCIRAHKCIKIGNNVKIGGDCILMDSDAHSLNYLDRRISKVDLANKKDLPITIEDDVLIGTRCIILKGVTIGARSIIGSGSVVTKSIPADCIAAGNPCKIIRYINSEK